MEKTFLEICNNVALEGGYYPITDVNLLDDYVQRIKTFVNRGYKLAFKKVFQSDVFQRAGEFCLACDRHFTTITSFDSLQIDGQELNYLPIKDFRRLKVLERKRHGQNIQRRPEFFTLWKKELHFFPHPNKPYNVWFKGHIQYLPLENNDDVPHVDSDVLIAYAKAELSSFHNQQIDMGAYQLYEEQLKIYVASLVNPTITQLKAPKIKVSNSAAAYR